MKSNFLSTISHELRTPMNAILGLTHLLRRDGASPTQAERLSKINNAAQHLMSIINDILDFSKIESGKMEFEEVNFKFPCNCRQLWVQLESRDIIVEIKFLVQLCEVHTAWKLVGRR